MRPGRGAARRPARPPARSLAAAGLALPALALAATGFVLGLGGGGVTPGAWMPVALAAAVVLGTLAAVGALPAPPRRALPALALAAALVAWSALSLLWSQAPEATAESVARTLLLGLALLAGATCAARPRAALALAAVIGAGGVVVALVVVANLLAGDTETLLAGRLSSPVNYANGAAALLFLAAPPLLALAAADALAVVPRAALGGLAALVLATGGVAESRGGTLAIAAGVAAVPVLARRRGRAGLTVLAACLPAAAVLPVLARAGGTEDDVRLRGGVVLAAAAAAAVAVAALALLQRRERGWLHGREGRVALVVVAVLVLAGGALMVARAGNPVAWVDERWEEFSTLDPTVAPEDASRFGSATSNRYDYWSVAGRAFADHPLGGVGAGAFAVPWARERRIDENVTDAHSWVAGALAETGIVGLALTAALVAAALAGAWRTRQGPGAWPLAATALGGAAVYYVLHAGVDWLGRIPAVAVPAAVALGALATGGRASGLTLAGARTRIAVAAVAVAAAAALTPLYLADRALVRGQERAAEGRPALGDLDRAAELNPWAVEPLLVESTVRAASGDAPGALAAAEAAVRRSERSWAAWAMLAEARLRSGDVAGARAAVDRVAELNPKARQLGDLRAAVGR